MGGSGSGGQNAARRPTPAVSAYPTDPWPWDEPGGESWMPAEIRAHLVGYVSERGMTSCPWLPDVLESLSHAYWLRDQCVEKLAAAARGGFSGRPPTIAGRKVVLLIPTLDAQIRRCWRDLARGGVSQPGPEAKAARGFRPEAYQQPSAERGVSK